MSIATRIEDIEQHLTNDYAVLTLAGADLTGINKNILNLKPTWQERLLYFMNNGTQVVWNNWNKVSGTGTTLSINNTVNAPMSLTYKGNTLQNGTPTPSSPQDIHVVSGDNTINVCGKNLLDTNILYQEMYNYSSTDLSRIVVDNRNCIKFKNNSYSSASFYEIGYKETPNNINKYAKEYDSKYKGYWYGLKNGAEWCSIFFSWLFLQFGVDTAKKILYQPVKDNYGASCSYQYQYYAKNNAITDKPEKGLQIFFKNTKGKIIHTGLIIKVTAQKIYTIEGNKDNQVKKCTYNINSSKIFGFGIPDYTYGYKKDDDTSAVHRGPPEPNS